MAADDHSKEEENNKKKGKEIKYFGDVDSMGISDQSIPRRTGAVILGKTPSTLKQKDVEELFNKKK